MLHGFGSSRDEIGGLFATQASALAESGIASLRIDFRGFGESAGEAADMTINGLIEDVRIARAYLEAVEFTTLEWVDWFDHRRILEPIGNIPPAEAEANFYATLDQPAMAA